MIYDLPQQDSLTHFCIITSWDGYNETIAQYATMLGVEVPTPGITGGVGANGTYNGHQLTGAFCSRVPRGVIPLGTHSRSRQLRI